ncbi:MAG: hypothetical protein DSM107014_04035 [Gomphosphaeria aponina SAG 52.96 = DSM 107014]|uniref:Uncharacterized protein n=1 Tax=Gomphosphaeria aponina SAG 52.96 = DSM 107014 TaxID=1521640 RepID=A0A941GTZ2_9CHRO|nr:hypothetical protein [Gomphosphaeria aponina SAG 52.96 = DSM 107014]
MENIGKLINQLTSFDKLLNETEFLAPCVAGGLIEISVDDIVYQLTPQPPDFTGWGIFKPLNAKVAELVGKPTLSPITEYLNFLQPFNLQLAYPLQGKTWLAYPINEAGNLQPVPVHLVTEGAANQQIIARYDTHNWWFEKIDDSPQTLTRKIPTENINFPGITAEVISYGICLEKGEDNFNLPSFMREKQ